MFILLYILFNCLTITGLDQGPNLAPGPNPVLEVDRGPSLAAPLGLGLEVAPGGKQIKKK